MAQSANSNTHLPGCAEKQSRNTTASKHPETQQSLTLYLSRHFFPKSRNPKLFSALSDIKKNSGIWYSDILLFKCFSILFILKKALPVLCPYFPSTYLIDVSFKQQMPILMQAYAGNHEQPPWATWTQHQTVSRQLNCHFDFVSVSESSKAWISNSDRAVTNQTVIVSLLQGKVGCVVRSANLASSSPEWFGERVTDNVQQSHYKGC